MNWDSKQRAVKCQHALVVKPFLAPTPPRFYDLDRYTQVVLAHAQWIWQSTASDG